MPVIGKPGGSLVDAKWASAQSAADAGAAGEIRTAKVLDDLAEQIGFTVFHDLRIPGGNANIDHVVVSGQRVTILDSKVWRPGVYWTLFGHTRRGLTLAAHADKRTLPFARNRLEESFSKRGIVAEFATPLLVLWSSRSGQRITHRFFVPRESRAINGEHLRLQRFGTDPADRHIVSALTDLI